MDITEDNYVAGLQAKNEKALKFFIEHDGWIVKSIVHKMMAKYQDKQEECMNDIFLAVWKNVDRYTGEKASFRTWLTAVARPAPEMPILKTKINKGSSAILRIPPEVKPIMASRASPSYLRMLFITQLVHIAGPAIRI